MSEGKKEYRRPFKCQCGADLEVVSLENGGYYVTEMSPPKKANWEAVAREISLKIHMMNTEIGSIIRLANARPKPETE